jgi:hypothetical protein
MKHKIFLLIITISIFSRLSAQKQQLFLLAGQSNAVGQGDSTQSAICLPGTAYEYKAISNECTSLKDPVGEKWELFQKAGSGSVAPAFAKRLNELTGFKINIVAAARGGASCNVKAEMGDYGTWDETGKNTLFADAIAKTKMAVKQTNTALSGIIWMQGERDANAILNKQMTVDEYQESLENVIHRFRKEFGKKMPFYIVLTGNQTDKTTEGSVAVQNAQQAVAKKLKQVYIAYDKTPTFPEKKWLKDNVHYNQTALNDIGEKVAETVFEHAFTQKEKAKLESQRPIDYNFGAMLQPVPLENRFIDEEYAIWCGSVIKDKNGKFYMLYSRWPRNEGHQSWIYSSEIALAKADKPEGPYKHVKVVLPARGSNYWDGVVTHNPYITFYKGKYYLYHMGTTGTSERNATNWWVQRNHQRIGVAVATDIEGDWKRFDKPVLSNNEKDSTSYDAMMVSNPAITFNDKGGVLMVYKQVCKNGTLKGGRVRFGVAKAKSPLGPFVKYPNTIFESKDSVSSHMEAEDPFMWFQKGYYYAIVRDVVGKFTGDSGALALMVSKNGIDWEPAKHPLVIGSSFAWADGTQSGIAIERPWVYFENGVPKFLYGAMGVDKKRSHTFNVAIPLK